MPGAKSLAFVSYVHDDDQTLGGAITKFREQLAPFVRAYIGEDELELFQDNVSIEWGQQWKQRIRESLQDTPFLLPILTPRFFRSEQCREELETFIAHERELGRQDLIMPVLFISLDGLGPEDELRKDGLVATILDRQRIDWREFRHMSPRARALRREYEEVAKKLVGAIQRVFKDDGSSPSPDEVVADDPITETDSSQAPPSVLVSSGSLLAGGIQEFEVDLVAETPYGIFIQPDDPTVDFDLVVMDEHDNVVKTDEGPEGSAYCSVMPRWTGPFRLVVGSARGASDFRIAVAVPAFVGELAHGEQRYVDLTLEAGRMYAVCLQPDEQAADFDLSIYDENGNLVAIDQETTRSAYCEVTPRWTGAFRVIMTSAQASSVYQLFIFFS